MSPHDDSLQILLLEERIQTSPLPNHVKSRQAAKMEVARRINGSTNPFRQGLKLMLLDSVEEALNTPDILVQHRESCAIFRAIRTLPDHDAAAHNLRQLLSQPPSPRPLLGIVRLGRKFQCEGLTFVLLIVCATISIFALLGNVKQIDIRNKDRQITVLPAHPPHSR